MKAKRKKRRLQKAKQPEAKSRRASADAQCAASARALISKLQFGPFVKFEASKLEWNTTFEFSRLEQSTLIDALEEYEARRQRPGRGRPRAQRDGSFAAIVRYMLDIKRGVPRSAARDAAKRDFKLSESQIKTALKHYEAEARGAAEILPREHIEEWMSILSESIIQR